ncbi:MAG: acetate--CoA ligase, partial [Oceanicaulis sp.]
DCGSEFVVTADQGVRGGKGVPLKANVDKALDLVEGVRAVLCVRHTGASVPWVEGRDFWHHDLALEVDAKCEAEPMNAEDPLFILYTSGSTGKPKGVLHTTGGYLLWTALTFDTIFDVKRGEVFWCTADIGWVTGHTYLTYGPLANGVTTLMFEGVPTWPKPDRFWRICAKHKVSVFYTAPTALRSIMREGDEPVERHDLSSLRLLGSVGEPINPEAWSWYHRVVGKSRLPIVDTWWQTETGACLMTPLPGAHDLKPGAASFPMFGVRPALVDNEGNRLPEDGAAEGNLVILGSWPGQMRTVWGDHKRFAETYFTTYRGLYFTGDGARRDEDGYWWITGRVDDVLNVSGHRLGTAEIESTLVSHPLVAEAAVVGYPHDIKGQGVYCYVTLNAGLEPTDETAMALKQHVRAEIGPVASPDLIQFAPALPKTRSGKIMRRILRKIAENQFDSLGDTSTLADPGVVDELIDGRLNR